ncbi:phage portal protein [Bradyrhizobium septentrionale]|uniref:Phage portal protein n=1 Tax=Bradyrhizobium septentrionale TaxID=1404411 RepID=A0A973W3E8_9BRAD|nr:phage portal protein [Bradyrhizobium septentrionale]UGY15133.1 phage portal protein [Bradyrhizobium septentrionale]
MRSLSPYDVNVSSQGRPVTPGAGYGTAQGADWFGPLNPIQPIAPPEVAGRVWDFIPGYNLATTPRTYEEISFPALRNLADSYDPMRLVIERRKDQMCRLPWTIRVKHEDSSKKKRPPISELPAAQQNRIKEITRFFKRPDREMTFRSWLRAILEDLLVIDAPSIFCERNRGGGLIGLRYVDGGTIKRVIDDWGRTPEPIPFTGQDFTWNGDTITLENHRTFGFRLVPGSMIAHQTPIGMKPPKFAMLPPAYQQVLKGLPAVNYTTADLIYRPLNLRPNRVYGYSPVEQVVMTVSIALRRSLAQLEYFREGNQPDAVYSLPAEWTPDQTARFQQYWDDLFSGNLANRRRMKFIPTGSGNAYTPLKEPPLKNEFDEWLVRIVCFAFSYPPAAFVSLSNRSIAEQHEKQAEEEGIEPMKQWVTETLNDVLMREFSDDDLEFAWAEEQEIDPEKQSTILRGYAEDGILTINQVREKIGEEPDPNPAASQLMVKTATGYVNIDNGQLDQKVTEAKAMAQAVPQPTAPEPGSTKTPSTSPPSTKVGAKAPPKKDK